MKVHLLSICIALVAVSICGAAYAQSSQTPGMPGATLAPGVSPRMTAPSLGQPTLSGTMPSSTAPMQPNEAAIVPVPAVSGAGPAAMAMPAGAATAMTTDNNYIYVMQGGMLYKFPKSSINACGTPMSAICGAGPACPTCTGISYIPGYPSQSITATTCAPCPSGCGPAQTTVICGTCKQPCPAPAPACGPCGLNCPSCPTPCPAPCPQPCTPPCPAPCPTQPSSCNPCGPTCPQPTMSCASTVMPASVGAGPCSTCPPVATVSVCTQNTICCLQALCGAEADKAYLQALIQLNQSTLALSNSTADHLGSTSLQDYATNSIGDSRSRISQSTRWLKTKYCMDVTVCTPGLSLALNICAVERYGREFDDAYRAQLVQYYVDEIAISQVEMERGLDCQVKAYAATVIRQNQERIRRLTRCNSCI